MKWLDGLNYLADGFKLLRLRQLQFYIWIPLLINLVIFILLAIFCAHIFSHLVHWVDNQLPGWLKWLDWILWILFAWGMLLVLSFGFTLVGNIVAAPFNALLSQRLEMMLRPSKAPPSFSLLKEIPYGLKQQLHLILYFIPRAMLCGIVFFIPVIQLIAAPLWFIFNAWLMTLQYLSYPMQNHHLSFKEIRKQLKQHRAMNLSFGVVVSVASLVPFLNLFVIPAAAAGATKLWVTHYRD